MFRIRPKSFRSLLLVALMCLLVLLALLAGCCSNPGAFGTAERTVKSVQGYYNSLLSGLVNGEANDYIGMAAVAADTTLLLADAIQKQWCPDPGAVAQLELQAQQAKKLAEQAGAVK